MTIPLIYLCVYFLGPLRPIEEITNPSCEAIIMAPAPDAPRTFSQNLILSDVHKNELEIEISDANKSDHVTPSTSKQIQTTPKSKYTLPFFLTIDESCNKV